MSSLFISTETIAREKLAASPFGGLRPGEKVVDLFCGAGGWGEGAKTLGMKVDYAVNHWPVAIDTHAINNPGCDHHLGDAWRARPRSVIGSAKLGLLLASAACTTHSRARGAAPVSKRVHMLGWCIARWMREAEPRVVMIENVPEWKDWGPLIPKRDSRGRAMKDEKGRALMVQDPARKGKHYRALLRYMRRLGYQVEEFTCDAPDFGEASRRKRLFIQARNDGQPIVWPEKTHGICCVGPGASSLVEGTRNPLGPQTRGQQPSLDGHVAVGREFAGRRSRGVRAAMERGTGIQPVSGTGRLSPHRSAAECIDWSDLGRSIFDRDRPLKPKTQARIAEGIRRYVIASPSPFVLRVTQAGGKGWQVSDINAPLPTQTTRQDLAVATPVMATTRNGERDGQAPRAHSVEAPLMTVTGGPAQGVAVPILAPQNSGVYGASVDQPGPTITGKGHQALIAPILAPAGGPKNQPHPVSEPMRTLLGRESFGIATPVLAGAGGSVYAGKPKAIDAPMGTVKCDDRRSLAVPVLQIIRGDVAGKDVRDPMPTITAGNGPGKGAGAGHAMGISTPVLMNNTSGHAGGPIDGPLPTVTTGGQTGLIAPILAYAHHGGGQHSDVRDPANAILSQGNHAGLVAPLTVDYYGNSTTLHQVDKPLGAVTTLDRHGSVNVVLSAAEVILERGRRVAKWLIEHLGDKVPIDAESGLAFTIIDGVRRFFVDVLFRMLKPRELAKAMGFPESYVWPKTQRDTVRLIGNAVSVRTARALLSACLPRGLIKRRKSA